MSLTASEIAALSTRLSCWEYAEYVSSGLVAVGCIGEYIADLTTCFTRLIRKKIGKVSTLLLIAALAGELVCLIATSSLSAKLFGSLDDLAQDAAGKSETAIANSETALTNSGEAVTKSDEAKGTSAKAVWAAQGASKDAAIAKRQANDLLRRLGETSGKLSKVEARVKFEGPRANLFTTRIWDDGTNPETNPEIKLGPFRGQKVLLLTGFSLIRDSAEMFEAEELASHLNFLVGREIAGWDLTQKEGYHGWGVEVVCSAEAPRNTKRAAKALSEWLGAHGITDAQGSQQNLFVESPQGFIFDKQSIPRDVILLEVGKHP